MEKIQLKPHNKPIYNELKKKIVHVSRCALIAATGTGKTYIAAKYLQEESLIPFTIVLVPNIVIKQSWKKLLPNIKVITYQSLLHNPNQIQNINFIVCDEMHHLGAQKWGQIFRKCMINFNGKILGLSATPIRYLDKNRNIITEYFDNNYIRGVQLPEAIQNRILPAFDYITALYNVLIPNKKQPLNKYSKKLYTQLDILRNQYSFENILKKHMKPNYPYKVVVFVNSIKDIPKMKHICQNIFPDAIHLEASSLCKKSENQKTYKTFESTKTMVFLYTVDILNEGAHLKGVNVEIMFRKTKSPIIYLQQLGRVLSSDMTNQRVMIFDFVANHMNLKSYEGMKEGTINWLSSGITSKNQQIIQYDYALTELALINKLKQLQMGIWSSEEDALLKKHYNQEKGIDLLEKLLPQRTRPSIISRAKKLGLAKEKPKREKEFFDDLRIHYGTKNGIDFLREKYSDIPYSTLVSTANRLGLTSRTKRKKWTPEEDSILINNKTAPINKLITLLPERNESAIKRRKWELNLDKQRSRYSWTDEDLRILQDNSSLTNKELIARFFPNLSPSVIQTARKKYGFQRPSGKWSEEKIQKFCCLYKKGGYRMVLQDKQFADMNRCSVMGAAHRYNVKVDSPE